MKIGHTHAEVQEAKYTTKESETVHTETTHFVYDNTICRKKLTHFVREHVFDSDTFSPDLTT